MDTFFCYFLIRFCKPYLILVKSNRGHRFTQKLLFNIASLGFVVDTFLNINNAMCFNSFHYLELRFYSLKNFSYFIKFVKLELVAYLANSKSVAAFLAIDGSLAIALFRLLITMVALLVLAPIIAFK